jgi:hypothetical protein
MSFYFICDNYTLETIIAVNVIIMFLLLSSMLIFVVELSYHSLYKRYNLPSPYFTFFATRWDLFLSSNETALFFYYLNPSSILLRFLYDSFMYY